MGLIQKPLHRYSSIGRGLIEKPLHRYSSIDSGSLCKLFRSPDVYIPSADDNTKPEHIMNFIDIVLGNDLMFVLGRDPRHEAFIFAPNHNSTTYQAHFAVREDMRDGSVTKRTAEAGKWIFEHTGCRGIISFILTGNGPARSVMGQLGMKRIGIIPASVKHNGEMKDEIIYYGTVDDFNTLWGMELGEVLCG